ncbi:MAG: PPOX class F420-dependent oxidoreductase [Candidatus Limnocylindria bacterium]
MEIEAAREFLRENHRGVLATRRQNGDLQMTPVLVGVDADGRAIISSNEDRAKVANLRRDPAASVCVFTNRFFGDWVQLSGAAEVLSLPDAEEPLVDYYRRTAGEHPDWDEYRAAMHRDASCLIRITLERAAGRPSSSDG